MNDYLREHLQVALHLLLLAMTITAGAFVAQYNVRTVVEDVTAQLAMQESYLREIAVLTDQNGADTTISKIISDCPRRDTYETLLSSLGTLDTKNLVALQNLSESCGNYYAERKALMVSKLERELENFSGSLGLLKTLDDTHARTYNENAWKELVALEKIRSELLTDQNRIQIDIITKLILGSTQYSKDVAALITEAGELNELLSVQDHMVDNVRAQLIK